MLLDDLAPDCVTSQPSQLFPPLESRENRVPPAPSGASEVADIVDQLTGEWQANWIQVLWHSSEPQPELLYSAGSASDETRAQDNIRSRIAVAAQDSLHNAGKRGAFYSFVEGASLTAAMVFESGVITITGFIDNLNDAAAARRRASLDRLLPLVKPFFAQWLATRKALARIQSMQQAIQISDVAIMMLGDEAEIIYTNVAADRLLLAQDGLRRHGNRLACSSFSDTLRLHAAVEQFAGQRGKEKGLSPVLALAREGRRPLTFALATALPRHGALRDQVKAIAYVFDPEEDLTAIVEPACRLYQLSHSETRLTCALVEGLSLAEAAVRLGLQEQTARSYLKHVFGKTATKRQAELVQLMLKSAVRFASQGRTQTFA